MSDSADSGSEIVLDLSRLLSRVLRTTPTGVDRVELTYALKLTERIPDRLSFAARFPRGVYGRLDRAAVARFLNHTAALWEASDRISRRQLRPIAARYLLALRPRRIPCRRGNRVFLQVSPHQLERQERTARILAAEDAQFVVMVHDVIPISDPEYARPEGAEQHRQRIATIGALADGVITNSETTRRALLETIKRERDLPVAVAHLGTDLGGADAAAVHASEGRPYFVCVGTIEPRKNHLLLLNVWKRLVQQQRDQAPVLHLVGRRGWENEQVIDMLERCPSLDGHVIEHSNMADSAMHALVGGACALLLPSFAEGFGMPVAEALAAGVPVIASRIEALREVGGTVPDFLDPLDGLGWHAAIID